MVAWGDGGGLGRGAPSKARQAKSRSVSPVGRRSVGSANGGGGSGLAAAAGSRFGPQQPPPTPVFTGAPQFRYTDLSLGCEIGKGRFKKVLRGTLKGRGGDLDRDVVVLRYTKNGEAHQELEILASLASMGPRASMFVPEIFGVCDERREVVILQEHALLGSVKYALSEGEVVEQWTQAHKLYATMQVATAMGFLESIRLVHSDLSCRNLLLFDFDAEDPGRTFVKVTDFGLALSLPEGSDHECRTQPRATRWCSPETIAYNRLSPRADVWSFGTTMWELFSGGLVPWNALQKRPEVHERLLQIANALEEGGAALEEQDANLMAEFPAPEGCSQEVHELLLGCLRPDEALRPSFPELRVAFRNIIEPPEVPAAAEAAADEVEGAEAGAEEFFEMSLAGSGAGSVPEAGGASSTASGSADVFGLPAGSSGSASTPSTSATPNVPMMPPMPSGKLASAATSAAAAAAAAAIAAAAAGAGPGCGQMIRDPGQQLFVSRCEALREFLCSSQAVQLLGDEGALEAFKAFLRSHEVREWVGGASSGAGSSLAPAANGVFRQESWGSSAVYSHPADPRSGKMPFRDVLLPLAADGSHADPMSCPTSSLSSPRLFYRGAGASTPSLEQLTASASVASMHSAADLARCSGWVLQSLVGPALMRKQEFCDAAAAWSAYGETARNNVPCMLRNPQGIEVAAQSWVVMDHTTKQKSKAWHQEIQRNRRCSTPAPRPIPVLQFNLQY